MFDVWDEPEYDEDDSEDENAWDEDSEMSHRDSTRALIHFMMQKATGKTFILQMEDPRTSYETNANYSLYPRYSQPCYGELRKYSMTHPSECTQPDNEKPSDLYWPFPDGKPVGLGLPFWQFAKDCKSLGAPHWGYEYSVTLSEDTDTFIKEFFTDDSPWRDGFGGLQNVEFYMHDPYFHRDATGKANSPLWKSDTQRIGGIVLKSCKIDPTVTVQMMWFIRDILQSKQHLWSYHQARAAGLSVKEACAYMMCSQLGSVGYHYTGSFSARRFFDVMPNDLTGGTLEDRYDYNRTDIAELWCNNFYEGDGVNYHDFFNKAKSDDPNEYRQAQRAFREMYDQEPLPIMKKWEVQKYQEAA